MKRYKCLFFDLDHTLIDTRGQYDKGLALVLNELYGEGIPDGYQQHFMTHHNALWKQYDRREITMEELRRERFLRAWKDFGIERTIVEADAFHDAYDATFETTLEVFPGTEELLRDLAGDHLLGIVTNGSPDLQWRKTKIAKLDRFFNEPDIIISARIGAAKPHPSVYEAACKQLGVGKSEALMIGDSFLSDVQGARTFGMDAVWYSPDGHILAEQSQYTDQEPVWTQPDELLAAIRNLESQRS